MKTEQKRAHIIDVNMGYGHSRAAFPLRDLSCGEIISANAYRGIPAEDKKLWRESRELYEAISRLKPVPMVGNFLFEALDRWQEIPQFYPRRDLSDSNIQLKQIYRLIEKHELGRHLVDKMAENPLPFVTTFFIPAFAAEYYDYPGDIYCIICDADISRTWAPMDPKKSRIKYFASNGRVVERLKLYGVREENIILTGFPLPKELVGGLNAAALKDMFSKRLVNLDPRGIFRSHYKRTLTNDLGARRMKASPDHPLTLTYMIGGAGAQRSLGVQVLKSLRKAIKREEVHLNLVAGTRRDVATYFEKAAADLGIKQHQGDGLGIPMFDSRKNYFEGMNEILKTTDVIWTKPSEMSFYTGLGFAIIMAPPIGSQEEFNRLWLQYIGGGVPQNDPQYTNEWLFDWVNSGGMARMAWSGYVEAPTHGTYRIEDVVLGRKSEIHKLPLIV
ncbi:MAG: hypothetical protein UX09_C0023G0002 [Candidatus Uhrbacteria bacterium GW2011_GWE2_45_35]|uniref:DUF6938 domain-containing protein n=2 Tax=Candidatus Uhriibacteriota TaxID=1752732 RepID=A0A0G1JGW8_9BACT|nr:MAG: hypothetical protein UW63_C0023G0002 [Candidatus Uhrbacteria bacterium GW2011_GWF2_44_350]KKU07862.1 MAG: hypothetical protein UX09_C0023G0002 [Candidatus Uhrbacteria bacterium GW2011_GWE2_45_35]